MTTKEFISKYDPCSSGSKFASKFATMHEVWEKCERPDWLFWILEYHAPLDKFQSVSIAIQFAEDCIHNVPEGEDRPRLAIEAAKAWLLGPTKENAANAANAAYAAACAAACAAANAAYAAAYAADAASMLKNCNIIRAEVKNPFID